MNVSSNLVATIRCPINSCCGRPGCGAFCAVVRSNIEHRVEERREMAQLFDQFGDLVGRRPCQPRQRRNGSSDRPARGDDFNGHCNESLVVVPKTRVIAGWYLGALHLSRDNFRPESSAVEGGPWGCIITERVIVDLEEFDLQTNRTKMDRVCTTRRRSEFRWFRCL